MHSANTICEIKFFPERALESLLFLAERLSAPTIHEILKLHYFADKLYLAKYGQLASGDKYVAMQFGPVASHTYDLLKAASADNEWSHPRFKELVSGAIEVEGKDVKPLRRASLSTLSKADVECLEDAVAQFGKLGSKERIELNQDAAWHQAWSAATESDLPAGEMPLQDIASTLANSKEVIEYLNA